MPKNPIEQFLDDLERELLAALKPAPSEEGNVAEAPEDEATEGTTEEELDTKFLANEAVRMLKRAEAADYLSEAEQLVAIADRYIRLTELVLIHG